MDKETRDRVAFIIDYSRQHVVPCCWIQQSYTDLTSMGREYVVPEKIMYSMRPMRPKEAAEAVERVIDAAPFVPGKIFDRLAKGSTYCFNSQYKNKQRYFNNRNICNGKL